MIGWAIDSIAASTLLMLAVLALRRPVAKHLGAHAAYLLWLLPAARMVLPRLPVAAPAIIPHQIHIDVLAAIAAARPDIAAPATQPAQAAGASWWLAIGLVWAIGALSFLGWQVARHRSFVRAALAGSAAARRHDGIALHARAGVSSPLALGLVQRRILLPADFGSRFTPAERRLALAHEFAHHARGDLIANAAALVLLAIHWFNPIAHWAYRAYRADQELACDASVMARVPGSGRIYGAALLKAACSGRMQSAACSLGPATELKRRMRMIANVRRNRAQRVGGTALVAAIVAAGLGLTASGSIAAPSAVLPVPTLDAPGRVSPPPAMPVADRQRVPPVAPVSAMQPVAAVEPVAAMEPVEPVSPIAPATPADRRAAIRAAAEAQAGVKQAQAGMLEAQAAVASANATLAAMDIGKIVRDSIAQARLAVAEGCRAHRGMIRASTPLSLADAAHACVDTAGIDKEIADALAETREEIRNDPDLPASIRNRVLAQLDRATAEQRNGN